MQGIQGMQGIDDAGNTRDAGIRGDAGIREMPVKSYENIRKQRKYLRIMC